MTARSSRAGLAGLLTAALALGVSAPAPAAPSGSPSAAERAPTRLGVTGREFSLVFSRPLIAPGDSLVQFQNAGEDEHDLAWKRIPGDHPTRQIGIVLPQEQSDPARTKFKAGARYRFWCTIADHRQRGMKATLRVSR